MDRIWKKTIVFFMYTYHICWRTFFPSRISYFFCTASWTWHSLSRWIRSWRRRTGPEKVQICTIIEQWITVRQKKMKKMYVTLIEKKTWIFYAFIHKFLCPIIFFSFFLFFPSFFFSRFWFSPEVSASNLPWGIRRSCRRAHSQPGSSH